MEVQRTRHAERAPGRARDRVGVDFHQGTDLDALAIGMLLDLVGEVGFQIVGQAGERDGPIGFLAHHAIDRHHLDADGAGQVDSLNRGIPARQAPADADVEAQAMDLGRRDSGRPHVFDQVPQHGLAFSRGAPRAVDEFDEHQARPGPLALRHQERLEGRGQLVPGRSQCVIHRAVGDRDHRSGQEVSDVCPAADVRGGERPACALHPDIRVLGRSDDDLADSAQPFGVDRDADREGRGAAAERHRLGRGPGGAADVVGGVAVVAHTKERAMAAMVVVAQRFAAPLGVAADVGQRCLGGASPAGIRKGPIGGEMTIAAQQLAGRLGSLSRIAGRRRGLAAGTTDRAEEPDGRTSIAHGRVPSRAVPRPCGRGCSRAASRRCARIS